MRAIAPHVMAVASTVASAVPFAIPFPIPFAVASAITIAVAGIGGDLTLLQLKIEALLGELRPETRDLFLKGPGLVCIGIG
jgi:hypothetical protein